MAGWRFTHFNCKTLAAKGIIFMPQLMDSLCFRDSIVVSISACHADDPGSIPGRGAFFPLVSQVTSQTRTFHSNTAGSWCSGITSALHAEGPGFKSRRIHFLFLSTPPRQRFTYHTSAVVGLEPTTSQKCYQTNRPPHVTEYNSIPKRLSSMHSVVVCSH